jgi:D-glucuronyl C5-epimerase C-terminus
VLRTTDAPRPNRFSITRSVAQNVGVTSVRPRARWAVAGAAVALVALGLGGAPSASAASILKLRPGATDRATAAKLQAVNDQWVAQNPGQVPCRKCEFRPANSNLLWLYYRNRGFFPDWFSAARDLLRRERLGQTEGFADGVAEIVAYSTRYTTPAGITFRVNESPYLSPDSTAPPWRDAMGQGLILTLFVEALPSEPTPGQLEQTRIHAEEYLNSFAVHWRQNGVAADGSAGGRWYLEYATERGDQARVLNGFMQTLVSLDRFVGQADTLAEDPQWAALRDRARQYVIDGARELNAHIDKYDYGKDKLAKYSLAKPDPAPEVYQVFHRQLLLRLKDISYLPKEWRDHFEQMRLTWGGVPLGGGIVRWWTVALMIVGMLVLLLALRRRQVVRRRRRRRLQRRSI